MRLAGSDDPLLSDVFTAFHGKSALIFANRKDRIEACADYARRTAERRGLPNLFRVHHGSLSKGEREETEEALRSGQPVATFCSSTLEMGIDVGSVKSVGQIGAPWSVNSLAQRMGRSGRKEGESSEIRIYIEEEVPGARRLDPRPPFPDLLQSVAMTELHAGEVVRAPGGRPPAPLHARAAVDECHRRAGRCPGRSASRHAGHQRSLSGRRDADLPSVLRSMGKADLIEQTPEGLLILGLRGERIVRGRDFYMAFVVPEEYRVLHQGRHIGNVTSAPDLAIDGYLILAGRRWKVLQVDQDRKEILVEPSPGGRVPTFSGTGGHDIHPRVREMMRSFCSGTTCPSTSIRQPGRCSRTPGPRPERRTSAGDPFSRTGPTRSGSPGPVRESSARWPASAVHPAGSTSKMKGSR